VIHDYKDFEIAGMAYPVFKEREIKFYIISFDKKMYRINPITPRYLENDESMNEVSRVLLKNLNKKNPANPVPPAYLMMPPKALSVGLFGN
jgi:hypothetical protein